jgi:type II secretory pathway pseudopilin PulG
MRRALTKYKIGLAVLGIFAIGLFIFLLSQASATKQDNNSYDKANAISTKLDDYINTNQNIPDSLSKAGITDVPDTITYKKTSNSAYMFCVNYKTKSTAISSGSFSSEILAAEESSAIGSSSTTDNTVLFINPSHPKGNQCQTVNPPIMADPNLDSSSSGSALNSGGSSGDPYAKCDSIQDDTAWQKCLDQVDQSQGLNSGGSSTFSD